MQFKGINPWINMKSTRQPIAGIESPKAIDANDNTIEIDDTFFRMMSVYVRLHCSIKTTNIRKIQFRIVLKMSDCLEWSECERERKGDASVCNPKTIHSIYMGFISTIFVNKCASFPVHSSFGFKTNMYK